MKSVIICEGSTDYVLLQYFMQRVNDWSDYRNPQQMTGFKRVRELKKAEDSLVALNNDIENAKEESKKISEEYLFYVLVKLKIIYN